ncbi:IS3 family transposase [Corynebacterium diphtheriae]|nr:IS3 family transposase [Corynebacterium diphtheriae]
MNNYNQFKTTVLQPPIESKQYVSIVYNERLEEHGISASTGAVGDSYDNTMAENVNGLSQERTDPYPHLGRRGGRGNRHVQVSELMERIKTPPEPELPHLG